MPQFGAANVVWLIPILPLAGFLFAAFAGKRAGKGVVGAVATAVVAVSFVLSVFVFLELLKLPADGRRVIASLLPGRDAGNPIPWINIAGLRVDYTALIDPLSVLMCLIVTGVGGLIHLYSIGYMAEDKDFSRFFCYLNLFIFFMLTLVLGANILLMFVGWEGVGLCSYLLISFWYEDIENSKAGNKAFIVNRIGDVAFALGVMTIFATFGTLAFYTPDKTGFLDLAPTKLAGDVGLATMIALLLFGGACGKSAQFPLYFWLPDAMAGPTPVSALIHAATMVTAGVVMISRVSPIVVQSPVAMVVIAAVGVFTAIFAASIAMTQNDIKKVLAYSTVSQLGYMFLGCGVGAFTAGMFHVMTHAFFKALLFLGAGAVIYAMHHEQDMRKMGGLAKRLPTTYWPMWCAWLAICGIFPFAGFWSKDAILGASTAFVPGVGPTWLGILYYAVGLLTALMTAWYMTRLMYKTFWGAPRFDEAELGSGHAAHSAADVAAHGAHNTVDRDAGHAGEGAEEELAAAHAHGIAKPPPTMTLPLLVLGALSVVGGLIGTPRADWFGRFLEPAVARPTAEGQELLSVPVGLIIGCAVGAAGILWCLAAYNRHRQTGQLLSPEQKANSLLYRGSSHLWWVDPFFMWLGVQFGGAFASFWAWIDRNVVDGLVRAVGLVASVSSEVFRRTQSGFVRRYALIMLGGVVIVVAGVLWPVLTGR